MKENFLIKIYASSFVLQNDICSGGCSKHCSEFIRDPGEGSLDAEGGLEPGQDFYFLSDPSPIIGCACHSLTNSLTHSCLVNFIDVTCGL